MKNVDWPGSRQKRRIVEDLSSLLNVARAGAGTVPALCNTTAG
jgi:hypothetical protein